MNTPIKDLIEVFASVATELGVFVAVIQLRRGARQARSSFEDALNREYRDLMQSIPTEAQFGGELTPGQRRETFSLFVNYFDLSNEQVFLRMNGRISRTTWQNWAEGIESALSRPAFRMAWDEVKKSRGRSFMELQRLEQSRFADDPWRRVPILRRMLRFLSF